MSQAIGDKSAIGDSTAIGDQTATGDRTAQLRVPAEWEPHEATFTALPHLDEEWSDLPAARREIQAMIAAIAAHERVIVLAQDPAHVPAQAEHWALQFGDTWTRDTLPTFALQGGELVAIISAFDGWGGKYAFEGDLDLAARVAEKMQVRAQHTGLILEGGGLEFDGAGSLMATRESVLPRNPTRSEEEISAILRAQYHVSRVIWLEGALIHDHTDGHIDTLARFVSETEVCLMEPLRGDPNEATLRSLIAQVRAQGLTPRLIPSPGALLDDAGALMPASYCNYVLCNGAVLVPQYGAPTDEAALQAIGALFPGREAVPLSARAILAGGGALHCITQQVPQRSRA